MSKVVLKRGQQATFFYTVKTATGALRPFAAGEYAVLSIGAVTSTGESVLQKSTANSSQGETTVGSPIAQFFFLPTDTNTTLLLQQYQADIWIGGSDDSPIPIDDTIVFTIVGRVNPSPPGP